MEHEKFAKIFENDEVGQILVTKGRVGEDDNPGVRITFAQPDMGQISTELGYHDDDEGWEEADKAFEQMTEEVALEAILKIKEQFNL